MNEIVLRDYAVEVAGQRWTRTDVEQMDEIERGELLHHFRQLLHQQSENLKRNMYAMARTVFEVDYLQLWRDEFETITEFLASPEIGIGKSTYYQLRWIYGTLRLRFKCEEKLLIGAGHKKAYLLKTYVDKGIVNARNVEDWLHKAETLTFEDMEMALRQGEGGLNARGGNDRLIEPGFYTLQRIDEPGDVMPLEMLSVRVVRGERGVMVEVN